MSVDARSIIDFKVGISFTKLFTNEIFEYLNKKDLKDDLEILSFWPLPNPNFVFLCQKTKRNR